jgi:hypothetical protein
VGGGKGVLVAPSGGSESHPVLTILHLASRLPDANKPVAVDRLVFVTDPVLREDLARDIDSMERHQQPLVAIQT